MVESDYDLLHFDVETEMRLLEEDETRRSPGERWWAKRSEALERAGYQLRPRFRAGWVPSWLGTKTDKDEREDGQYLIWQGVIDATCTSDGSFVFLKEMRADLGPYEKDITAYFSSEPLKTDPKNHCIPLIKVLDLPELPPPLLVLPMMRPFYNPAFQTFGEAVPFFTQIFEGVQFMHRHNIAHRDCTRRNIVFDPSQMYPDSFHPMRIDYLRDWKTKAKYFTRTQRPPRYYLLDFGLSRRYDPADGPPLDDQIRGGDKSAPEHRILDPPKLCNPFHTDIYYLGNLIRKQFTEKYYGFAFMDELVTDMVHDDPSKRPTIEEVVFRFEKIRGTLSTWKLRSRLVSQKEIIPFVWVFREIKHVFRTAGYVLAGHKAAADP
ncbi:hypothetical protein BV25DRAFT_1830936 [Artomyces pyxidatus]|uniref:Uncharacterized protein n=2 Tax=Artomyces pyxidatus TaxID=48021 RepID=A0ACB8SFD1_9AGAM|nr:hypothetical protein BV25DRAFT_1833558 [Artomyces pyxidatus]KAI0057539.1 hypothetical protein BV25DRAFT_1830936 [Artomyces pyxidatus]